VTRLSSMLRNLWNRLAGRETAAAERREAELEHMSPEEQKFERESIDDYQADEVAREHLGVIEPDRLLEDDSPPT
jgi:hypothetical protein